MRRLAAGVVLKAPLPSSRSVQIAIQVKFRGRKIAWFDDGENLGGGAG